MEQIALYVPKNIASWPQDFKGIFGKQIGCRSISMQNESNKRKTIKSLNCHYRFYATLHLSFCRLPGSATAFFLPKPPFIKAKCHAKNADLRNIGLRL